MEGSAAYWSRKAREAAALHAVRANGAGARVAASAPPASTSASASASAATSAPASGAGASSGGEASLYLDTISRARLDFDFERVCSVSLSAQNVYACLVCGRYFQGRGPRSWAAKHAVDHDHRVWMKISGDGAPSSPSSSAAAGAGAGAGAGVGASESGAGQVYILPEGHRLSDPSLLQSLSDIRYLLEPTFSAQQVAQLDAPDRKDSVDLQARRYKPGFVGLNNLGGNDYINVVIQALAHVKPLRDHLLLSPLSPSSSSSSPSPTTSSTAHRSSSSGAGASELTRRFALLLRKMWNPRLFKPQVSPHELLQEVNKASKGKFQLTSQGDPVEFLGWLLNQLHNDLAVLCLCLGLGPRLGQGQQGEGERQGERSCGRRRRRRRRREEQGEHHQHHLPRHRARREPEGLRAQRHRARGRQSGRGRSAGPGWAQGRRAGRRARPRQVQHR